MAAMEIVPPGVTGQSYAAAHGLSRIGARPPLWSYLRQVVARRHFVFALARSRVQARNQRDLLGSSWMVIQPLLLAGVYLLVFGTLLGTGRNVDNFPGYLTIGVFFFQYLSRSVQEGSRSIAHGGLARTIQFPRAVMPLTVVTQNLLLFVPALVVMVVLVLLTGEPLHVRWLLLPLCIALMTGFIIGLAMILARLVTHSHDVVQALPFTLRLWMYLSGVFWTVDKVSDYPLLRQLFEVNPAYVYIAIARSLLLENPPAHDYNLWALGVGWAVGSVVVGIVFFWAGEERYGRD
jgi:teichoic acid transport system permease protein